MMTWQGFPLPLLRRSSNKLEAARGRPRLAPAIARQASRPINPPHPVSQWKQTSFGASSAIPTLPSYNQTCSRYAASLGPADCRGPGTLSAGTEQRTPGHLWSVQRLQRWHWALSWPGSATSLCTLQSQLVTSGAPEEWWTWIEQINDNTFNVDKTFLTQCRDWETFLKFRVTVLQKYQENVSKFTPSHSR